MQAQDSKLYLDKRLILSVIGSEHPEIMTTIAEILSRFKGTFLDTQFNSLHNHFSGVFSIAIHHMYMKPFMACLASLASEKVRFEFESQDISEPVIGREQEKIRFDISIWGAGQDEIVLDILRLLNKNHLDVECISEKVERFDALGEKFSSQLKVSSDFVVDIEAVEIELQQLATNFGVNLMILSDEEKMLEAI